MTHEGLMYGAQDPDTGTASLALINSMIGDLNGRGRWPTAQEYADELHRAWRDDMIW